jgi:hypothetical protein
MINSRSILIIYMRMRACRYYKHPELEQHIFELNIRTRIQYIYEFITQHISSNLLTFNLKVCRKDLDLDSFLCTIFKPMKVIYYAYANLFMNNNLSTVSTGLAL